MMKTKWLGLTLIVLILWIQTSIAVWAQVEKVTAIVHVNLVPMTDERILPDQTVIVKNLESSLSDQPKKSQSLTIRKSSTVLIFI